MENIRKTIEQINNLTVELINGTVVKTSSSSFDLKVSTDTINSLLSIMTLIESNASELINDRCKRVLTFRNHEIAIYSKLNILTMTKVCYNELIKLLENPVIQLRKGAPDKINIFSNVILLGIDNADLRDLSVDFINEMSKSAWFLPADEGDIKYCNDHPELDTSRIILPTTNHGIIDYNKFVNKSSQIYQGLSDLQPNVIYPRFESYSPTDFIFRFFEHAFDNKNLAFKSELGSGSRGVALVDESRLHLGGRFIEKLTLDDVKRITSEATKHGSNIIVQELIPNNEYLLKCNVDFAIRNGKLLGYKFDIVDQTCLFTNWNHGYFIRSKFTDDVMNSITQYLVDNGVVDAIMNFECFADFKLDTIYMVEFNWRYSNSMFEFQALGGDIIYSYIFNTPLPTIAMTGSESKLKFSRYWQCKLYQDIPTYIEYNHKQ